MKNVSDRCCKGNQNTRFMLNTLLPKIVKFVEKYGRARHATHGNIIRCMRFAC
jgi:hypothetical protein